MLVITKKVIAMGYGTQPWIAKIRKGGSQGLAQLAEVSVFGGAVAHFWHVGASVLAAAAAMVWWFVPPV